MVEKFLHALARDGFTVTTDGIRRMRPEDVHLPAAQDEVDALLERHGFKTARGHLDQARNAHGRGEWVSANAQLAQRHGNRRHQRARQSADGSSSLRA